MQLQIFSSEANLYISKCPSVCLTKTLGVKRDLGKKAFLVVKIPLSYVYLKNDFLGHGLLVYRSCYKKHISI